MPSRDNAKHQSPSDQNDAPETAADEATAQAPKRRPRTRAAAPTVAATDEPQGDGAPEKRGRGGKRGNPARLVLPVLVSDEALLLPHMSIPLPIEDDETAAAVDRAMRMDPRRLLILTERKIATTGPADGEQLDRDLIDIVSEMIARENEETGEFTELGLDADDQSPAGDEPSDDEALDGEVM
jgi:hypothetical protein